jgi:hypothetical protein
MVDGGSLVQVILCGGNGPHVGAGKLWTAVDTDVDE